MQIEGKIHASGHHMLSASAGNRYRSPVLTWHGCICQYCNDICQAMTVEGESTSSLGGSLAHQWCGARSDLFQNHWSLDHLHPIVVIRFTMNPRLICTASRSERLLCAAVAS